MNDTSETAARYSDPLDFVKRWLELGAPVGERIWRILMAAAVMSGAVLLLLSVAAALGWKVSSRSILNWEGICGFALVLASLGRVAGAGPGAPATQLPLRKFWLALVLVFITACFARVLFLGFLSDDFVQTQFGNTFSRAHLITMFRQPTAGVFFRPLEYVFLRGVGLWAGFDPVRWHATNLALHLANSVLVYFIVARLLQGSWTPAIATLLFGVHGTRPEAVAWANGRLDLFTGFCLFAALLMYIRYCEKRRTGQLLGSLLFFAAALLTKESAYAFPLLLLLIAAFRNEPEFRLPRIHILYWLLALIFFAYRWNLLGGIGGYSIAGGGNLRSGVLGVFKVILWRVWALLYFPINWSSPAEPYLLCFMAVYIVALLWMIGATGGRRPLWFSLAFAIVASLPALSLLLIGADLEGSRLLYVPAIGYCMWVGISIEAMQKRWMRAIVLCAIAGFHCAALAHNLDIWQRVSTLTERVCTDAATSFPDARAIVAVGLPRSVDGVLFIANGFPECVQMHSRKSFDSVVSVSNLDQVSAKPDSAVLVWNNSQQRLERIR